MGSARTGCCAGALRNAEDERVIGTALDHKHPAYALMLEDKPYTGRARLFGRDYMTHYEPLTDAEGRTVGILFVGQDYGDGLAALKDQLRKRYHLTYRPVQHQRRRHRIEHEQEDHRHQHHHLLLLRLSGKILMIKLWVILPLLSRVVVRRRVIVYCLFPLSR